MKPVAAEWVEKAEGDFRVAGREFRARKLPRFDAVCFHAQQCVEKYLKGRIEEAGQEVERTHHLLRLLDLAVAEEPL